jgi:signal transduction histidine kinase
MSLLRRIVAAAMELTESDASSILLLDPNTGDLRFEMASNLDDSEIADLVVPIDGSIAGWVVTHGEARVIRDVNREPNFYRNVDDTTQFRTRNILAVPMRVQGRVIGTLEALNKRQDEYDEGDIKILTTLASQAALAIENARMFQQRDFMSEMVHELRNPLAALKTSLALLLRMEAHDQSAARVELIGTLQGEIDRLVRLTTEYLDLARLESGRARLEIAPFDLMKLVHECVEIVEPQAATRSVALVQTVPALTINADRGKIKQVLLNLLTNAIKYNGEGGTVTLHAELNADRLVVMSVRDTGMGIPREAQKNMFQKFYRVHDGAGQPIGTGLGLAIAKRIVESHKGSMWFESEQQVGSTFYFTLPAASS